MGISLKPSSFTEGQGFLDDVQAEIVEARFCMWDYNGTVPDKVPALELHLQVEGEEEPHVQFWSMGRAKDFLASKDGKSLTAVGTTQTINNGSNGAILLTSMGNSGLPEDLIDDDISVLKGTVAHFIRQAAPTRNTNRKPKEGDRPPTILVVDQIIQLPGQKPKAGAKKNPNAPATTTAKAGTKAKVEPAKGTDMEADALNAVQAILVDKKGTLNRQQIPALVFAKVKDNPLKNDVVKLAFSEEFLAAEGRPWLYADGQVMSLES